MEGKGVDPTRAEVTREAQTGRSQANSTNGAENARAEKIELEKLSAYLARESEVVLFWKPLNLDTIYVNLTLIGLLIVSFLSKFFYDRPQGAYFEKISLLFFVFCSVEALQTWAFTKSTNNQLYYSIHSTAQYLIIVVLLAFVYVCSMRLRFLLSPVGQYYERQILLRPERVTRWRDEIDRLVLKSFLRKKTFVDRLAVLERDENPLQ